MKAHLFQDNPFIFFVAKLSAIVWLFGATLPTLLAETWVGGGSSSWNDSANWDTHEVPSPGIGAEFVFDGPTGNKFGFGGTAAFRASSFTFTTNAGPFLFSAPEIILGGSTEEDKSDGFVLETIFSPGLIQNLSTNTQSFVSNVTLGWDTVVDATNGNIAITGNLKGPGFLITKKGNGDLLLANGKVNIDGLSLQNGRLALINSEASVGSSFKGSTNASLILLNGSTFKTAVTNGMKTLNFYPQLTMAGVSKETGSPCVWDLSLNNLNIFGKPFVLSNGASITNAGALSLIRTTDSSNVLEYVVSDGASLYCQGFNVGYTSQELYLLNGMNVLCTLVGTNTPGARPTTLDVGGKTLYVGYRAMNEARCYHNILVVKDGARVVNAGLIAVSGGNGANFNSALFFNGAHLSCSGLSVGAMASSNTIAISGLGTQARLNGGDIRIGHSQNWGWPSDNRLIISDGAQVDQAGEIVIGQCRTYKDECDRRNSMLLKSGAKLHSKGVTVSDAGSREGVSTGNVLRVEGSGTFWNLTGGKLGVGYAGSGNSVGNTIIITDGAMVTNIGIVNIGVSNGRKSLNNKLLIANGSRLFSTATVQVGLNNNDNKHADASGNLVEISGGKLGPSVWDLGAKDLYIGSVNGWNSASKNNKFVLLPGSVVKNVGDIKIGNNEGDFKNNALVLAGGMIRAQNLWVKELNCIDVLLSDSGISPILIEKNVTFDFDTYVSPQASPAAKPGRYPLLGWKGKATNLDKLKLAKAVDKNIWKLEVIADKNQIFLNYKTK